MFASSLRISTILFLSFTVLLGIAYPSVVTGIVQVVFHQQANGSLIVDTDNDVRGSALIGQNFSDPKYFWGRLSATGPVPYNAAASSGSNLGSANEALRTAIKARIAALQAVATGTEPKTIPVDLVTASGSGLDPHISIAAANYQVPRITQQRHISEETVTKLIRDTTQNRQWGIFGEPRVNVLQLNLALDKR